MRLEKPHFPKNSYENCLKVCGITDTNDDQTYPTLAGTLIFGEYPPEEDAVKGIFIFCAIK